MQSRCCWPPESMSALSWRRSFTSSYRAAFLSEVTTRCSMMSLSLMPPMTSP